MIASAAARVTPSSAWSFFASSSSGRGALTRRRLDVYSHVMPADELAVERFRALIDAY